jgi:hypothetical protein
MYKAGFMNAWSIGFIPKEIVDIEPDNWRGGHRFDKWELLEYSAVLVPDNPEALTLLRSKGLSDEVIEQGTHVEAEVEASKVEQEIAAAAKQTEKLENNDKDDNDADDDHRDNDQEIHKTITTITYSEDFSRVTLTVGDEEPHTYSIAPELQTTLQPAAADPEALAKALSSIRDSLRPADKEIGLALRTLKSLLAKPTN